MRLGGDFIAGFCFRCSGRVGGNWQSDCSDLPAYRYAPRLGQQRSQPLRRGSMTNSKLHRYPFLLVVLTLALATSLAKAQTYTDLHNFNETDGCCASAPSMLAQGQDGDIYGATTSGGIHFYGNIFKITPSGTLTSIHDFDLTHGGGPQGGISMGMDGNFYGTTYQGGKGFGTVFKITPSGTFTELYDFTNTTDGAYPKTPPVQAQDGNLYGTTNNGTIAVLYKISTADVFTPVVTLAAHSYSHHI